MTMHFTSREFNQDVSRAKRATADGPVFITDRGREAHVLLTAADYRRLAAAGAKAPTIMELLADPASAHIDFDPPRMGSLGLRIPDFEE